MRVAKTLGAWSFCERSSVVNGFSGCDIFFVVGKIISEAAGVKAISARGCISMLVVIFQDGRRKLVLSVCLLSGEYGDYV